MFFELFPEAFLPVKSQNYYTVIVCIIGNKSAAQTTKSFTNRHSQNSPSPKLGGWRESAESLSNLSFLESNISKGLGKEVPYPGFASTFADWK